MADARSVFAEARSGSHSAVNVVVVFAPSPVLTVTVEGRETVPDVHLHAGGQGVCRVRMLPALGSSVTLCCVLTGETGQMLGQLVDAVLGGYATVTSIRSVGERPLADLVL
ncbi:hypothetical protein E3T23_01585 [Cryobacterium cheniae]|uniref:Uncharacterized protein n=1 Tax=Cryobacterium cheniae TaxID=1259262 RepID=A0A4V3IIV3_9MICO|nr:hypothetical protein [Cryobacterium cheniae]TFC83969.1 hypothetical protein E3T23_01585 [Cryobacterium cheniae]